LIEDLRKAGFVPGDNLRFDFVTVDGQFDRMAAVAAAVARSKPDVILSTSSEFSLRIKEATSSIPVVSFMNEAVLDGFAKSYARPEGNFTGISWTVEYGFALKAIELVQEIAKASRISTIYTENRSPVGDAYVERFAREKALTVVWNSLRSPVTQGEFRRVFENARRQNVDGIVLYGQPETFANFALVIQLAEEFRIPTLYGQPGAVRLGGLIEFTPYTTWQESARLMANFLIRILKGAKPGDLPIFHADRTVVRVNLKTAKQLGITVPETIIARAHEVVE
jgi:putative ABC transport system substrate-binding protein